jgi:hypothetical protein
MNRIHFFLAVALLVILGSVSTAQELRSKYQLKRVRVATTDGRITTCRILDVKPDSLIVQDETRLPVGSKVFVKLRYTDQGITGYIGSLSATHVTIVDRNNANARSVPRNQIETLRVKSTSLGPADLAVFQRATLPATNISYIAMHKGGSGGLGAIIGMVAVAGIMYAMYNNTSESAASNSGSSGGFTVRLVPEEVERSGPAVLGGLVGLGVGAAIGSSNKKHRIDGNPAKFDAIAKRIKGKSKNK